MNDKVLNESLLLKSVGSEINVKPDNFNYLFPDTDKPIKVELYCPFCKEKRVFKCVEVESDSFYLKNISYRYDSLVSRSKELLIYNFSCEYNHNFKIALETLGNGKLIKFGQFPSPMFFSKSINNDVFKMLDNEEQNYYLLSLKSRENNLNIASFVYLRRVFESLVEKSKNQSKTNFTGKKIKEIIKQLVKEKLLNEMLNDNGYNVLYSLLSDGIHNLSEDECNNQFELLKSAIEIILEDEIYKKKLEKRKKSIGNMLSNVNSEKLSKNNI